MFMQGIEKANPASESWHAGYFKLAIIHHVWFSVQAVLLDAQVSFEQKINHSTTSESFPICIKFASIS